MVLSFFRDERNGEVETPRVVTGVSSDHVLADQGCKLEGNEWHSWFVVTNGVDDHFEKVLAWSGVSFWASDDDLSYNSDSR